MGDGQVSQGDMVVKPNATKVRKLADGSVLAGYAGSTADAMTLMERLEGKLEEHEGTLLFLCSFGAKCRFCFVCENVRQPKCTAVASI